MKDEMTTIQLTKATVEELKGIRKYKRETYDEVISSLIKMAKKSRKAGEYDEFLFTIQQPKMRELWDNKYDDVWERA